MATRILALDYGLKRIGLAISDALGITAQGLHTLDARAWRTTFGTSMSWWKSMRRRG